MTLTLPPEIESRLNEEARRQGIEPAALAVKLLGEKLPPEKPTQSLAELFEQWAREDATDDPAEIERRNRELDEFMEGLNRNRLEMEGPGSRRLWP